jgi:Holliday junction resolvasome RuvABC endonuclease subunit
MKPLTILGINPGTRYIGLAVLSGTDLREWRIVSLKSKWSVKKLGQAREILSEYISRYHPDGIALKRLHESRSSPHLTRLAADIKKLLQEKRIQT